MPSRKRERLDFASFKVGFQYSRPDIAELGQVAPLDNTREWTDFGIQVKLFILCFSG
jgi:hypothetical protein